MEATEPTFYLQKIKMLNKVNKREIIFSKLTDSNVSIMLTNHLRSYKNGRCVQKDTI